MQEFGKGNQRRESFENPTRGSRGFVSGRWRPWGLGAKSLAADENLQF